MAERGRVVVITGASAGVGRATVRRFAEGGWDVGLIARGLDGLEAARREAEGLGVRAAHYRADVADARAVDDAASYFERELGPIDAWVNNAMVSVFAPVRETTAEEYRRVTEVTYLGYVHGTQAALRRMVPRDAGTIVQVGSALAYRAIPLQSAYCAAKHAIQGFSESLRSELLHDGSGVEVKMVQLPALNTPQFGWVRSRLPRKPQPVPPIFQPEVAADAIYWTATHSRPEIFVGWPTGRAIWANRFEPRLLDHYLAKKGLSARQTEDPVEPGRRDNLYAPLPGDHGARGSFGNQAKGPSTQLWLTTHRPLVAGVLGGLAAATGALAWRNHR